MVVSVISQWAKKKGIGLVATGDWTHPIWLRELKSTLEEAQEGVYRLRGESEDAPLFLLSTEVSSIYSQGGKTRRIHTLIFAPNFDAVEKINKELVIRGANLMSDGRPIVGLSARQVAQIALETDERCLIIPAHAWTPWFSLYGSMSGFDSIEECFGDLSGSIYAIETGLSSDPAMNWRIEELGDRRIVSFSDAHSPQKLGREATVFQIKESKIKSQNDNSKLKISYKDIYDAISGNPVGDWEVGHTIEFYPEEGKYHYTGHRNCKVVYSPKEARKKGVVCPVCGKNLTVGVMSRVEHLASVEIETEAEKDKFGVRWIKPKESPLRARGSLSRRPYLMLVPLMEIIAEAQGVGVASKQVMTIYEKLVNSIGSEFKILLETERKELEKVVGPKVAEGIMKVRSGDIVIEPGYDGVFGKVKIWKEGEDTQKEEQVDQATLF